MASRHGGSDGSLSARNQCGDVGAFSNRLSVVILATHAVALFLFLVIFALWIGARQRNPKVNRVLTWYGFGFAAFLPTLSSIVFIIISVLGECAIMNLNQYFDSLVPATIFWDAGEVIFLAVIMLPVNNTVMTFLNKPTRTLTIMHSAMLITLALLAAAVQGVWGFHFDRAYDDYDGYLRFQHLVPIGNRLYIAYHSFYLVMAFYSMVLLHLWLRKRRSHQRLQYLLPATALFLTCAKVIAIVVLVVYPASEDVPPIATTVVFSVLDIVFFATSFIFLIAVIASSAFTSLIDGQPHQQYGFVEPLK